MMTIMKMTLVKAKMYDILTLVAGEHAKLVGYTRYLVPDRSKLVFFVLDINGALSPQTKEVIDDDLLQQQVVVRFSKIFICLSGF